MGGTAYTGSRPGYVYTTRHGVTDYYPDAARPSLLTRLASWRGTGPEAVVAEPVGEEDEVAALRQRIARMQAQLAEEEAAEAREKEASERRAAEELAAATRAREEARRAQELQKAAQRRAREAEAAREARAAEAKTKTVLLVGLAGAGKTTALHQLKLGEVVTHHVLEVVELTGWNFTACDLGHPFNDLLRHNNVGDVRGLVFVVDSTDADRLQQARDELHRLCKDKRLREAVLLVFANKQDVPTALYPRELEEKLGLNGRKFFGRPWHVQACCATNGDGLCEGLDWLQREEAARRRAAEEKARLEAEQRALEEEHARERRELAEKQRALAAEHAAEKKALAAKKAEAEARAREVEAEARRAREAAEAKAREEADGTYAAGPFLDGTYVKGCAEINQ